MRTVFIHIIAILMVIAYTNLFVAWRFVGQAFGGDFRDMLPFLVVALMLAVIAVVAMRTRGRDGVSVSWLWLAAAVVWALIGLASTDPRFPAKRIHVPEYAILCCVLWLSIRAADRTRWTLLMVFVVAALYGVHDEFLQGLHPRRTFGVRDMVTNFCGAAAGAFLVGAFTRGSGAGTGVPSSGAVGARLRDGLLVTLLGVVLLASGGVAYRFDLVPYWTVLPLLAAGFVLALTAERFAARGDRIAARAIVAVCLLFAVYPLVINVALLDFA